MAKKRKAKSELQMRGMGGVLPDRIAAMIALEARATVTAGRVFNKVRAMNRVYPTPEAIADVHVSGGGNWSAPNDPAGCIKSES